MSIAHLPRLHHQSAIMHILDLPPELVLNIAAHLTQADLLNISLTNRRLRDVTEPELFREYSNASTERSFKPFLWRLIDRPELAKYVRRVDLRTYYDLSTLSATYAIECTTVEYKVFTDAAVTAGVITTILPFELNSSVLERIDDQDEWYDYVYDDKVRITDVPYDTKFCKLLRAGTEEPLVILLLSLLPNLRCIDIRGTQFFSQSLEWRNTHSFRALTHFTVHRPEGTEADNLGWSLGYLNRLLCGANMTHFNVLFACGTWLFKPQAPLSLAPRSTKITHLTLSQCSLTKTYMEILLQACAPLEKLHYSAGGGGMGSGNFNASELMVLLEPHKHTLRELYLNLAEDWDFFESPGILPTLRDYTQLKHIDTNMESWSDILLEPDNDEDDVWAEQLDDQDPLDNTVQRLCDRLPPSLECLTLHELDDLTWDYRQLVHLVLEGSKLLPSLKLVELVESRGSWLRERYSQLTQLLDLRPSDSSDGECVFEILSAKEYRARADFLAAGGLQRSHMSQLVWDGYKYWIRDDETAEEEESDIEYVYDLDLVRHVLPSEDHDSSGSSDGSDGSGED
ncbi:hypothetical protein CC86DRAFT_472308 [Ophiobolus disseminans]|uniref:F-box domain-containing protein n=1 Tax=Ophiobolus disseminans TaxID=1469910 RepID=A0A6A6ZDR2_9PLEO|nr:hypothetical protein CC86DRAFT_472308 [Ophiobolus disseminans]